MIDRECTSQQAGFSGSQDAYEEAYHRYFAALSRLNDILTTQTFVAGDAVTESDLRLFPTVSSSRAVCSLISFSYLLCP